MGQSRRADDDQIWEADTQSSDPQVHCLEEYSKAKVVENCQYTSVPIWKRLKLFFAQLFVLNQLSIYGAVSDMCDEYNPCHVRTGRLVSVGQSDPLFVPTSVMKTPTPLTDDPASYHNNIV